MNLAEISVSAETDFGRFGRSLPKIESVWPNFLIIVVFVVIGVFLAFYTLIDKVQKCIVPFHSQNLIVFGLIPKNI